MERASTEAGEARAARASGLGVQHVEARRAHGGDKPAFVSVARTESNLAEQLFETQFCEASNPPLLPASLLIMYNMQVRLRRVRSAARRRRMARVSVITLGPYLTIYHVCQPLC